MREKRSESRREFSDERGTASAERLDEPGATSVETVDEAAVNDTTPGRQPSPSALPTGDLLSARTVGSFERPLRTALNASLTGYLVIEPMGSLLLGESARGIVTLADGVPVLAYETATDSGGSDALAVLADGTPARVQRYRHDPATLAPFHERTDCRVPPDDPARQLADDAELARHTRERVADDWEKSVGGDLSANGANAAVGEAGRPDNDTADADGGAVAAFLSNAERIDAIRAEARAQARDHADAWGLHEQLAVPSSGGSDGTSEE